MGVHFEQVATTPGIEGQWYDDGSGNHYIRTNQGVLQTKGGTQGATTFGTVATVGVLHGAGTSSSAAATSDTAGTKFMSYYLDCGAESGDARGLYLRLYLTGAGGGGESARLFTTVSDVAAATAHGAHISLSFGTSGSITGLGVANRNTLHIPAAMSAGTYAVAQIEAWADTATADLAGATSKSFLRIGGGGDSTGLAALDDSMYLIDFYGIAAGSGNVIDTDITALTGKAGLRVTVNGTLYGYIPIVTGS